MASRERKDSFMYYNHLSHAFGGGTSSPFGRLGRDEIRLFRLEPGQFRDQPQGSFEIFDINSCPFYRAVSYEWFDDDPIHPVTIGATFIHVRFNLCLFLKNYQALMDMHEVDLPHYIWIDHLCIDQENTSEKSYQVQLMHRIYRNAIAVIAWLGPDHDQHSRYSRSAGQDACCSGPSCCVRLIGPSILNSSFFSRLWIQQEMVLARKVIFMVGRLMLSASRVLRCMKQDLAFINQEPALQAALKSRSQKDISYKLIDAIALFSRKKCADTRDKVYGLLGIVWPHHRIPADYTLRRIDVFRKTVDAVFSNEMLPMEEDRKDFVVSTLLDLAHGLGVDYWSAYPLCRIAAATEVDNDPLLGYNQRRWSNDSISTITSSSTISPPIEDYASWKRIISRNTSGSSFSSMRTQAGSVNDVEGKLEYEEEALSV